MRITTCFWFDGGAEAAAAFYCDLFDGARLMSRTPEDGPAVLVVIELLGQRVSFLNGGPHYTLTPAASLVAECADQAEIDRIWEALAAAGISEGLVRISVGIESIDDLIEDIGGALKASQR